VRRLALGSRAQVTTVVFGAFGVDDGAMGEQAVRKASRGALPAQRRAIEVEQRAAWVYERGGNVDGSARERGAATREQQRLAAAERSIPSGRSALLARALKRFRKSSGCIGDG
jgi:hypothetical protein